MTRALFSLAVYIPAAAVVCVLALSGLYKASHIPRLTRDLAAQAGVHPLTGLVSNLGALLWVSTAGICFFAAYLVRARDERNAWFLLSGGCISLYAGLDDFLMIHEQLAPVYLSLDEKAIVGLLAISIISYTVIFIEEIRLFGFLIFVSALMFFGFSFAIDQFIDILDIKVNDWYYFFEDGSKWLGIYLWSTFHIFSAAHLIDRSPSAIGGATL
jgi:hypothetical protein